MYNILLLEKLKHVFELSLFIFCRADIDKKKIVFEGVLPSAYLEADYEMDGRFLVLPIKGKGRCRFDFSKYVFI